jgi:hypothetical protein
MSVDLKNQLEFYVEKEYCYNGENVMFSHYKQVAGGNNVVVFLNNRPKNLLSSEVRDFLNDLMPAKAHTAFVPEAQTKVIVEVEATSQSKTMKDTLMEMLEKVKQDPGIMPQAKSMVEIANAMVNIQKTELQAIEITHRLNKR